MCWLCKLVCIGALGVPCLDSGGGGSLRPPDLTLLGLILLAKNQGLATILCYIKLMQSENESLSITQ